MTTLLVAGRARQSALECPAPVPIHDDAHVPRQRSGLQPVFELSGVHRHDLMKARLISLQEWISEALLPVLDAIDLVRVERDKKIRDVTVRHEELNFQTSGLDDLNTENPRVRRALAARPVSADW